MKSNGVILLRPRNIAAYLIALYVIISSYSVYMVIYPQIGTPIQIGLLAIALGLYLVNHIKKGINGKELVIAISIFALMSLTRYFSGVDAFSSIMITARFIACYLLVSILIDWNVDILETLFNVIFSLSVIMFACYIIFDLLFPTAGLTQYYSIAERIDGIQTRALYNIHYGIYARWATKTFMFGLNMPRFSGFCWEPGQYMIYLNYALFYLLFIKKNGEIWKYIVIGVSLIFTCSAMGWMIAICFILFWNFGRKSSIGKYITNIVGGMCTPLLIYLIIVEKMETSTVSFLGRMSDLELVYDVLFRNTLFGNAQLPQDLSNSFIRVMCLYGYVGVFVLVLLIITYMRFGKRLLPNRVSMIAFALWIGLSLVNEPLETANIVSFIISLLIFQRIDKRNTYAKEKSITAY